MLTNRQALRLAIDGRRGRSWYTDARRQIQAVCERNRWDVSRFVGILAVTSPRVAVRRNIRTTYHYMLGDDWTDGTIRSVRTSVATYETTGRILGPKTSAFYRCLMGCGESIVLDTWMAYAFGVPQAKINQVAVSRPIKATIGYAAYVLGWSNAEVQAAIWTATMAEYGRNDQPFCIEEVDNEFLPF